MKTLLIAFCFFIFSPTSATGQFNSGSTGADGALNLSTMTCPNNICIVQLPESGRLDYTTVNVPAGLTLRFTFNSRNTPVIVLATGNIVVNGTINVSSGTPTSEIEPGPGGFYGGQLGQSGLGPGGGTTVNNDSANGRWVGSLSLVPIIGGSGSGSQGGNLGLGGGGAIVLASSTSIIVAAGGTIRSDSRTGGPSRPGSGGAIRLVANTLSIAGSVSAVGFSGYWGGNGTNGIIRFEAPQGAINYTGTATPTAILSPINPVIFPSIAPTLAVASIGGYIIPSYSSGRPDRVDLVLPTQLSDPISVVIQGSNVPSGTQVQIQLSAASGTATGCTLAGGPGPVSCSASVTGLNRNGVSTLLAFAVFTPSASLAAFNPKGENHVVNMRLESALDGKQKYSFFRANGSEIDAKRLDPRFRQEFGL